MNEERPNIQKKCVYYRIKRYMKKSGLNNIGFISKPIIYIEINN